MKRTPVYQLLFWCEADVTRLDQKSEVDEMGCSGESDHGDRQAAEYIGS